MLSLQKYQKGGDLLCFLRIYAQKMVNARSKLPYNTAEILHFLPQRGFLPLDLHKLAFFWDWSMTAVSSRRNLPHIWPIPTVSAVL